MKQQKTTADSAETISGTNNKPATVRLKDGREIQIIKCQVKNLGKIMNLIIHIFEKVSPDGDGKVDFTQIKQKDILKLIAESSDMVFESVASLTTMDIKELMDLELDDAVDVILKVWEVNQRFFLQAVLPRVGNLIGVESPEQEQVTKASPSPLSH